MARVAGVVLAAGEGSRMGGPKADVVVAGERLLDRAVRVLRAGACDPLYAVIRADTRVAGATPIVNPAPQRGMRSSLELAVAACSGEDALAVLLVDLPGVDAAAVRAVVGAWVPGRIAVGDYGDGARGHPTVMSPSSWRQAIELAGPDEGARTYLRVHADLVDAVAVSGSLHDLDTPEDLAAWPDSP